LAASKFRDADMELLAHKYSRPGTFSFEISKEYGMYIIMYIIIAAGRFFMLGLDTATRIVFRYHFDTPNSALAQGNA
jgi:hypothetical protein